MIPEHHLTFGPFRLETTQGRLWRGDQEIPLRPRSLAMLGYLVTHAGRLVTQYECQRIHEVYQLNYYTTEIRSKRGVRMGGRGEIVLVP